MEAGDVHLRVFRVVNVQHGRMPLRIAGGRFRFAGEHRLFLSLNSHTPPHLGKNAAFVGSSYGQRPGASQELFLGIDEAGYPESLKKPDAYK